MKKIALKATHFSLLILLALGGFSSPEASAAESIRLYHQSRTDSEGYDYGADFYVDSSISVPIYVKGEVEVRDNVIGGLVSRNIPANANETHVLVGSFIQKDQNKGWSVSVRATYEYQ
ncbi:hypothetical protein [Mycobacterium sp. D16R24]|uniref:hypothetical protein n=1 Tax=Mycobacterium sp. D16R24 TaxID=1855656 RepID=UPI001116F7AA|nr:hypothetical protein [Mycobacterium sp. D16R24]